MATVNELYKEHEQLKRDGKNEEAIGKPCPTAFVRRTERLEVTMTPAESRPRS